MSAEIKFVRSNDTMPFNTIETGEFFLFEDNLYIKSSRICVNSTYIICIRLNTGTDILIDKGSEVLFKVCNSVTINVKE